MFIRNGESYGSIVFYTALDGETVWNIDGYITTDPIYTSPNDLTIPRIRIMGGILIILEVRHIWVVDFIPSASMWETPLFQSIVLE